MTTLALQSGASPFDLSHPTEDLEKAPVERVLTELDVRSDHGLSSAGAQQRLTKYGPNALVEKEVSVLRKILGHFTGPIAYMIEAAAIVSAVIGHWDDFAIIAGLLFFNAALEFWQNRKASNAMAALKKGLAPEATALRDGKWQTVQATTLVPGGIVKIRLGAIVPADLRLVGGLSSIFLNFAPLTAVMIVLMSLLDDVPIMTIAYDNTPVSAKPIRWQMPQLLGVAAAIGVFSIVESFGLLLVGIRVLSHPHLQEYFGLATKDQLRTVMFLLLATGGHLLLFVTRTERWFFLPPFPAVPLFSAILLTQILVVVMCGFGWLMPRIPWTLIGWVLVYNIAWMFILGGVRLLTESFVSYRTARHIRSVHLVNQSLGPQVAS